MRILVDYRPALRARTGVGEYIHTLIQAYIAGHNDEVMLFTSSWKDRPSPSLETEIGARVVDRRVPVSVLNLLWHRAEWPPVEWLAPAADVVHSAHPLLIPTRDAAQVVTIHDLFFLANPDLVGAEIRRDYVALAGAHARRAHAVVTSTHHTKRLVTTTLHVPPDLIYVCPPGAPTWRTLGSESRAHSGRYLLCLGTVEPRKNLGVLLDAYGMLLSSGRRVPPLVIAGGLWVSGAAWIERLGQEPLRGHVSYKGFVTSDTREELYANARGVLVPSLDEGFGLTALEAMSAGVPVVTSNRGSLPEVVGEGGVLLDAVDVEAWAATIERLGLDENWVRELGRAGLNRARAFSWEQAASTLHLAYRDARARRGAA